jgi:hypothetical protein
MDIHRNILAARTSIYSLMLVAMLSSGCASRSVQTGDGEGDAEIRCNGTGVITERYFPQGIEANLDLLFVIDSSPSMADEQQNLVANFPRLIDKLRNPRLKNDIPDVHIGVVSSDLGAGSYRSASCREGGDGAKLQYSARSPECKVPKDPWISYVDYKTNIVDGSGDAVQQVKDAFSCIAKLGTNGCAFEQPLEAARRALDPGLGLNPGFLREGAFLMIVFITDEDDCSAADSRVYNPSGLDTAVDVEAQSAFYCFEKGILCAEDTSSAGSKSHCVPSGESLTEIDGYVKFFKELKPLGMVLMATIAGPTDTIEIVSTNGRPALVPGCDTALGRATPAPRLKKLMDDFGSDGNFVSVCGDDYGPVLARLGEIVVDNLHSECLPGPPLTEDCHMVCAQGAVLGKDTDGNERTCQNSCLEKANCTVEEIFEGGTSNERTIPVDRCPTSLFDPRAKDCGSSCPCWRILLEDMCSAKTNGSPFWFEIMRENQRIPRDGGRLAKLRCSTLNEPWGTAAFSEFPVCQ